MPPSRRWVRALRPMLQSCTSDGTKMKNAQVQAHLLVIHQLAPDCIGTNNGGAWSCLQPIHLRRWYTLRLKITPNQSPSSLREEQGVRGAHVNDKGVCIAFPYASSFHCRCIAEMHLEHLEHRGCLHLLCRHSRVFFRISMWLTVFCGGPEVNPVRVRTFENFT